MGAKRGGYVLIYIEFIQSTGIFFRCVILNQFKQLN